MTKKNIFLLFLCDAASWVCLLYAQVWFGRVHDVPQLNLDFIFGFVTVGAL